MFEEAKALIVSSAKRSDGPKSLIEPGVRGYDQVASGGRENPEPKRKHRCPLQDNALTSQNEGAHPFITG